MRYDTAISRSRRLAIGSAVAAIHAVMFALVLALTPVAVIAPPKAGAMSLIELSPQPEPPPPAKPPALPSKLAEQAKLASPPVATAGGPCATLDVVTAGVLADPAALASTLASPPDSRSVAQAMMIWNEQWSEAARSAQAPLGAVRAAIRKSLATVEDHCLDEQVVGPRMIVVPDGTGTILLVVGSGNWSWRALLVDPRPAQLGVGSMSSPVSRGAWQNTSGASGASVGS